MCVVVKVPCLLIQMEFVVSATRFSRIGDIKKGEGEGLRTITKALNYTEIVYRSKNSFLETVMVWILKKPRKPSECGTWIDGKKRE